MKSNSIATLAALLPLIVVSQAASAQNADRKFDSATRRDGQLEVHTSDGSYLIKPYSAAIVETTFVPKGEQADPASHAVVLAPAAVKTTLVTKANSVEYATPGIVVTITKSPFQIAYAYKGRKLVAEKHGYLKMKDDVATGSKDINKGEARELEAIEFALDKDEALYGAGERAVGMNRRGHRFTLYNKAHYGYGDKSEQMGYAIPVALSSRMYAIHFDNPQTGYLDFDSRKDNSLTYETIGGRKTYQVVAGDTWEDVVGNYTSLTGKQPLPPRWAFGNFAMRFGYRNETVARQTVDKFIADDIPLDAIVFDLFWFGKEIKGTMGNLEWDKDSFPNPTGMIADFQKKGVQTVVITEPFILDSSSKWQEAIDKKVLGTDADGKPLAYDFYFGHTGLIDIFAKPGKDWFWNIYKGLRQQGVTGVWGDLGEPEVHPTAMRHAGGLTADQVHNIYGHQWARLVAEGYQQDFPTERPFILMRAGYSGSQRYGIIPWSGDVDRGWGGLQSQPEISLQMGMQGAGYMHSDLGGFANPVLDNEPEYALAAVRRVPAGVPSARAGRSAVGAGLPRRPDQDAGARGHPHALPPAAIQLHARFRQQPEGPAADAADDLRGARQRQGARDVVDLLVGQGLPGHAGAEARRHHGRGLLSRTQRMVRFLHRREARRRRHRHDRAGRRPRAGLRPRRRLHPDGQAGTVHARLLDQESRAALLPRRLGERRRRQAV